MNAQATALTVSNLACERGGRRIFENLTFQATAGEFSELRGPNGSGKSSLLRLLAGLDQPAAGDIKRTGNVVYVGHLDGIKPALTVRENLAFWAAISGAGNIGNALAAFNLQPLADELAGTLSQGQRHRLSLSRLSLSTGGVWLLDEPTVGLDDASLKRLRDLIDAHCNANGIVIAATHVDLGVPVARTLTLGAAS
jgi:heme exporter protein A